MLNIRTKIYNQIENAEQDPVFYIAGSECYKYRSIKLAELQRWDVRVVGDIFEALFK